MASAETVMAVYSDREDKGLESRMRSKDSCPVWGEGAGKVPDGNSPTPYSTARRDLWGRCRSLGTSTRPTTTDCDVTEQPLLSLPMSGVPDMEDSLGQQDLARDRDSD
jgi:hypothetical protein